MHDISLKLHIGGAVVFFILVAISSFNLYIKNYNWNRKLFIAMVISMCFQCVSGFILGVSTKTGLGILGAKTAVYLIIGLSFTSALYTHGYSTIEKEI